MDEPLNKSKILMKPCNKGFSVPVYTETETKRQFYMYNAHCLSFFCLIVVHASYVIPVICAVVIIVICFALRKCSCKREKRK